jgi:hypothetical protein
LLLPQLFDLALKLIVLALVFLILLLGRLLRG